MKVKLNGVWNIRTKRFESENGLLFIYWKITDARRKVDQLGRFHPDGGTLRRVMPIRIGSFDNEQIIKEIYS